MTALLKTTRTRAQPTRHTVSGCFGCAAQVLGVLKTLRIGSLSLEDMAEEKSNADIDSDDPYAKASRLAYVYARRTAWPVPCLLLNATGFHSTERRMRSSEDRDSSPT